MWVGVSWGGGLVGPCERGHSLGVAWAEGGGGGGGGGEYFSEEKGELALPPPFHPEALVSVLGLVQTDKLVFPFSEPDTMCTCLCPCVSGVGVLRQQWCVPSMRLPGPVSAEQHTSHHPKWVLPPAEPAR